MSFPRYPEYKDSRVEWLGQVPAHWAVAPLKHEFSVVGGSTPKSDTDKFWDGEIVWVSPADLSKLDSMVIETSQRMITDEGLASCGTTMVPKGSIVLSTRAPIGSLAIAGKDLCTNQGCKSLIPKNANPWFYAYLLSVCTEALNVRGKGTTFLELSGDELGSFRIPIPTLGEQEAIAAFLEVELRRIDELAGEQEKLIALLKEKRQAVISHAVTKGLDPNVPMKDSGIEWLGEVPAHWEVLRLGDVSKEIQTGPFGSQLHAEDYIEGGVPVVNPSNIQAGMIVADWSSSVSDQVADRLSQYKLFVGDIVFGRRGEMGRCALTTENEAGWLCGTGSLRVRLGARAVPRYTLRFLQSSYVREWLGLESVGSTMDNLNTTILSRLPLPLPPINEQVEIARGVDILEKQADALVSEAENGIELLNERRSALVSAAVTGKIDVRPRA